MSVALLAPALLAGFVPHAVAAPPESRWPEPAGLDSVSPLMNCEQARAAGLSSPVCGWKLASDGATGGSLALGLGTALAYTIDPGQAGRAEPGVAWASGFAATLGAAQLTKTLALRPRPYTYNPTYKPSARSCPSMAGNERDDCWSFFSGHTATTAYNLFYAASAIDTYTTTQRPLWTALSYTAATLGTAFVGTARVQAGQHFWSDVAVGAVVGAGLGLASPRVTHAVSTMVPGDANGVTAEVSPTWLGVSGSW